MKQFKWTSLCMTGQARKHPLCGQGNLAPFTPLTSHPSHPSHPSSFSPISRSPTHTQFHACHSSLLRASAIRAKRGPTMDLHPKPEGCQRGLVCTVNRERTCVSSNRKAFTHHIILLQPKPAAHVPLPRSQPPLTLVCAFHIVPLHSYSSTRCAQ